jgi:hypothetical protein
MESGTPGSKSTADGWLNRYLQAKRDQAALHEKHPFRAGTMSLAKDAHAGSHERRCP